MRATADSETPVTSRERTEEQQPDRIGAFDIRRPLRWCFLHLERWMDAIFTPAWNPLYQLGALGFFYYWVVAVSGIYVYILFDTGTTAAYESVQYMTEEQWYLGGVMRSLHRYASDGMVLMMLAHVLREFALGRYRGPRWFTWVTGVPVAWLIIVAGITGYWLVWDKLAQYVAVATTEWLDWLGIFGVPIARNFLSPTSLDDRFFTLLMFIHVVVPLLLLLVLWIHLQRVTKAQIHPRRGLAVGTFVMLLVLSLIHPAVSQGPADLGQVPTDVQLDWYYLAAYPLMDLWSNGAVWAFAGAITLMLCALPWLPPLRRKAAAVVDLANCNGCTRCVEDCPYNAVTMQPRSDGRVFDLEARVSPNLCVSCGICMAACPTTMPFRRRSDLVPGIDLPQFSAQALRKRLEEASARLPSGPRVLLIGCDHGARVEDLGIDGVAGVSLPCIAALPPSYIDYALSRGLAEGVFLTGCREETCYNRWGVQWMEARLAGERDPALRGRVPRDRIGKLWAAETDRAKLRDAVEAFRAKLAADSVEQHGDAETKRAAERVEVHG
ncbi:MAG: cytochrome b N-terminal domain-containing protein [Alphaproteobacteria bacterium]|nr:cytochrome b N-terminal domain-containing protein [Alphaproteobacteria bacterium]